MVLKNEMSEKKHISMCLEVCICVGRNGGNCLCKYPLLNLHFIVSIFHWFVRKINSFILIKIANFFARWPFMFRISLWSFYQFRGLCSWIYQARSRVILTEKFLIIYFLFVFSLFLFCIFIAWAIENLFSTIYFF